jgi:hypothetical protein
MASATRSYYVPAVRDAPGDSLGTGWTRSEFLRRAAGGGAGLLLVRGAPLASRLLRPPDALAADALGVQHFFSRPDLQPTAVKLIEQTEGTAPGYLFLTPFLGFGAQGVLILDNDGEVVWWRSTKPKTAMNLRSAIWKGRRVLTWWEGKSENGIGKGECVIVDQHYREIARFRAGHRPADLHDLVITPRGTALVTSSEIRHRDLTRVGGHGRHPVIGGVIQELDLPNGRVRFEWRSLDHVALSESHVSIGPRFDYFHANSIGMMPDGDLLVSARNTWALYKIGQPGGRVVWRLGGKRSDFHMGPGTHFYWQHDARSHGPHLISIFDDGAAPPREKQSRALLLAVNHRRRRVTLERAYTHQPPLLAAFTGSTQVLHNRNVLVGWGGEPYLTEFARDGSVTLDMQFGAASYRALRFPWSGQPRTDPALVAVPTGGTPVLYVSWNGATEVAAWQLLAGPTQLSLQPAATVPRTGFETQLAPGLTSGYAAVRALDAAGQLLGQSGTVKLG